MIEDSKMFILRYIRPTKKIQFYSRAFRSEFRVSLVPNTTISLIMLQLKEVLLSLRSFVTTIITRFFLERIIVFISGRGSKTIYRKNKTARKF